MNLYDGTSSGLGTLLPATWRSGWSPRRTRVSSANSSKSWDVRASDDRLLQVKSRVIGPDNRRSQVFSPFRTFDFDACVFVIFDARDYSISNAIELPAESVRGLSRRSEWVAGNRVRVFADLLNAPGAVDVTALLQDSLAAL